MAWLCCHCGSLRADNVCVYEVTNVCGVSATAALIITNGAAVTCPGCPLTRGAKTNWTAAQTHTLSNAVDPSRCSSSSALFTTAPGFSNFQWTVSGPGSYSTNGTGLSATFSPTNAGSGTLTFSADVFLPTIALPCDVTGAPTISVSTDFTVLEVASLIPGFGSLTNVARVINSNHTEYRYCRQTSGTISVAATPSASVADLPDCWNLNGTPKTLTTVVPVDLLGTNTIVCVAGTSGKTNSLIGTTVALAQTNTVFACVGDTNTFSVTGESFAEITWEIVPPEGGGGGASFLGTNTGHEVQILAGSSNCDFYYVRPYVTGLRDCAVQTPFKVIRVDSLGVGGLYGLNYIHTNDTWQFCAVEPGAETTNINVSVTLVPSVGEADLPASYSLTNTGPGVGGEGKLSRTVNLTVVGTNIITARGGSSSKSVTVIVSRAKIAQTGPLFFCVGTTNEFSLTADSSGDVTWEITPTPGTNGPGFAGSSNTGRTVLIRAGSECGDYSAHAYVTGLSNCTCSPATFKVVKVTSLQASGLSFDTNVGAYVTCAAPTNAAYNPVQILATACPRDLNETNVPPGWSITNSGPSISGTNNLYRLLDDRIPGSNVVVCTSGNYSISTTIFVVSSELKSIEFTSDHNLLKKTPTTTNAWADSTEPFEPVEWIPDVRTNPISHTKNLRLQANVTLRVQPPGVRFDLIGSGSQPYVNLTSTNNVSTTNDQVVPVTAEAVLPDHVGVLSHTLDWKIRVAGSDCSGASSGPHKIYLTYGTPTGSVATEQRLNWDCTTCTGESTLTGIADKIYDALASAPPQFQMHPANRLTNQFWLLMSGTDYQGQCIDLAELMQLQVQLLGGEASVGYVYGSTNTDCYSTNDCAWRTRTCPGGLHGEEMLLVWSAGAWNSYEAVCEVANICYAIKVARGSAIEILRTWLGANTLDSNYQAWWFRDTTTGVWEPCMVPGPRPVPAP